MKKRLVCLFVAVIMLVGMTSCVQEHAIDIDDGTKYNMTLTLWIPTSPDTTDEAVAQVESAINKITKKNFQTAIDIIAVAEDEYDEAIKKRVLEVEEAAKRTAEEEAKRKREEREAKKRGETLAPLPTEAVTEIQYVTDENGELEAVYPAVKSDQLDIFCIRGYENFFYYADNSYIEPLGEYIDASSKIIKSYVYPTFLEWGKIPGDSSIYAVPNAHVIGDYTYLLINKELCDGLFYDPTEFVTTYERSSELNFPMFQQFVEDVGATSDITPLLDEFLHPNLHFWNSDKDHSKFSLLTSVTSDEDYDDTRRVMGNIFNLSQFNKSFLMMKQLKEQGYIAEDPSSVEEFGAAVIKCDASEISQYEEDYYVQVIAKPRATTEDIYQSMFAVSAYTLDAQRSMEIITAINTDSTIRTLLQYGVHGTHWDYNDKLTEDGEQTIKIISDDYKMNLMDTGNVFLTYPGENIPMSYWESGKQQNIDSKLSPYLGFNDYITDANKDLIEALDKLSAEFYDRIDKMTAEEYEKEFANLKTEVAENITYIDSTSGENPDTITGLYISFYDSVFKPQT